jgi:anthranilate synthase/aminodeoxychorismate synthase-like glutamine amidotransferase
MIVVIDNYDSFTYNLVQFIGELGASPDVYRNDATSIDAVRALSPNGVIVSPGPGRPENAGISVDVYRQLSGEIPLLGVCLGHQSMAVAFGATVERTYPLHGKSSLVQHDSSALFADVPSPFRAGRYHSLVAKADSIPENLVVTAWTDDGIVMGLRHREHKSFGVQFHPESILTQDGMGLLKNFLVLCGELS